LSASPARGPHGGRRPVDVFDVKADAEAILAALGAPAKASVQRARAGWWHPGRSGQIGLGPKVVLAAFGEVHPKILRALDVKGPAVAFTLFPERIPAPKARAVARPALVLSDLQAVERDFAFLLDAGVEAANVVNAAAGADRALIEETCASSTSSPAARWARARSRSRSRSGSSPPRRR
jgi:phenylalanyl-tRNA synthetase beta chain